ncbi:MAG TPA: hypothetical protein VM840_02715, partial [Actinomycetota bacterium]|nr:hypothetical protein [Actinomycetota bacterium]
MPRRFAWWASTPSGLLWLFVAGAAIRLWLATRPGFSVDMGSFRGWAVQLDDVGPRAFYPPEAYGEGTPGVPPSRFIDYPPGYLYVLWGLGAISRRLFGVGPPDVLLKLPPILGDLALAWVVVQLAARLTPAAYRRVPWRGTAAAAVLLNPALIVVSALWGQVDVFQALLILGAFLLLGTGAATFQREAGGLALLVLAVLTKPQALFVVPVAVLVLVWRHARAAAADPAPGRLALALARIAALGVTSAAFALLVIWPFLGPNPVRLLRFYQHASSTYPHTSVWAFNLWGALGFWKPDSGPEAFPSPAVPAVAIGWTLFAVGAAFVGWRAWRSLGRGEAEGRVLLAGALSLTLVAFAVLTRIHERYLFVVIAGLAAFAAYRGLRWALAGLSLLYLVNVWLPYGYYTFFHHQTAREDPPAWYRRVFTLVFGDPEVTDTPQRATLSLVGGLACLFVAWRVWTWLEARSGAEEAVSAPEPPVWARSAAPVREQAPPPWTLTLHPVGLRGAAIALLVFVVALATKVVGLGHPAGMYFDEVYHARTAGEYLEGQPVYEWTHPPLAKLGMAASIRGLSRFRTTVAPDAPAVRGPMAAGEDRMYAVHDRRPATVVPLAFDDGCSVRADGRAIGPVAGPVTALAASGDRLFVGADDGAGGTLHRFDRGRAVWTVPL